MSTTGKQWHIDQVPAQRDRVAIVTGANSGIGFETALALARKQMEVVLACRDLKKAEVTKERIMAVYPSAIVKPMVLDLARLASVRTFVEKFRKDFSHLHLLINNAGIMMSPYQQTEDGFENQLATNYIGHFLLTGLLMPVITKSAHARVVTLTSLSYKWAEIQFDDLHFKRKYSRSKAYGQSKRACLIFAFELQRRLIHAKHQTRSVAAHPGLSKTNLDQYFPSLIRPLGNLFLQPAAQGALPVLYAALDESIKGGEFIGPDGFKQIKGNPTRVQADNYTHEHSVANRLWQVSEKMTGIQYLSR